jgi:demethylmenaquinone methyltransferase/2-methoxy-6-polyprenyl-1,4-benzoquinol methylase
MLQQLYDFYSFQLLPTLGEWVAQDRAAYQYLVESIRRFPDQDALAQMIKTNGFSTATWENLCNGISCIHTGIKAA